MNTSKKIETLSQLSQRVRYQILRATSQAGSGHPTSSLSAVELMCGLLFGGAFRYNLEQPEHPNNDRLVFSKGHASPLFYALWASAGQLTDEQILTYRQFGSNLEGHPTTAFPYCEAATGSLGQGLSIGVGFALNAKYLDELPYRTYILLGDSEMAEGSQWEAIQLAAHYKLNNLVGVLDVNRLGQRGETMYGHDLQAYEQRVGAFGWQTITIDGHRYDEILDAYETAAASENQPVMIIAKTVKGKGVSFLEGERGWHGKALDEEKEEQALKELGEVDTRVTGTITMPEDTKPAVPDAAEAEPLHYKLGDEVATRKAYGQALKRLYPQYPTIVGLDGEVCNSTRAKFFRDAYPDRFFEMFIAEQNMVGAALGLSRRGKTPFVSTFAAFLSRAFDQIRMSQYSDANIKFAGSHAGVSIGEDGPSQMGLEDLALYRTLLGAAVLYPCDAVSTEQLVEEMARHKGLSYLRTTRGATPVIYPNDEPFPIGGSKVLRQSENDRVTIVAAGVTVHEALAAQQELASRDVQVRVIDLYSVKPVDEESLSAAATETDAILTVEDHYAEGGLGEAVSAALSEQTTPVHRLAVRRKPKSGKPEELRDYEEISANAIVKQVEALLAAYPAAAKSAVHG